MAPGPWFITVWSSQSSAFYWRLRCYVNTTSTCPREHTDFSLFVAGVPDDLNWPIVLQDLALTGVQFASPEYKWFYAFSESSK